MKKESSFKPSRGKVYYLVTCRPTISGCPGEGIVLEFTADASEEEIETACEEVYNSLVQLQVDGGWSPVEGEELAEKVRRWGKPSPA